MNREHVETSHARIFENNKKWVESMKASDPKYFEKLSSGQVPDYLYRALSGSVAKLLLTGD